MAALESLSTTTLHISPSYFLSGPVREVACMECGWPRQALPCSWSDPPVAARHCWALSLGPTEKLKQKQEKEMRYLH